MSVITLPGSKSLTNRALLLAALAQGQTQLSGVLFSDDTQACMDALKALGIDLWIDPDTARIEVHNPMDRPGRFPHTHAQLFFQASGTLTRFLMPLLAAQPSGHYVISAESRMQERPLAPLLHSLIQQGAEIESLEHPFKMPLILKPHGLSGGAISIETKDSSQFASGLLLAAPLARTPVSLTCPDALSKKPYIQMTLALMKVFGVSVDIADLDQNQIHIPKTEYISPGEYCIEPDASTASYFYGAAALLGCEICVKGIFFHMLQGDTQFLKALEWMGCVVQERTIGIAVIGPAKLRGLGEWDMTGYTDTFMTLAALAPFASSPTTLTGLRHTRLQESDRISAMQEGLSRLGVRVEQTEDTLTVYPCDLCDMRALDVSSFNDHRIAMALALVQLKIPGMTIEGALSVSKTCPDYFERLGGVQALAFHSKSV